MTQDWRKLAAIKKESVDSLIPEAWRLPKEILDKYNEKSNESVLDIAKRFMLLNEFSITENHNCSELVSKIAASEISAVDAALAFMHRASIASQLTNCNSEIMFEHGLERAKFLDSYLKAKGEPIGPLHGLPISIKDSFNVRGYDSTLGTIAFIGNGKSEMQESDMVATLLELGAVLYIKTNIPLSLMTGDSENQIFGRTLNPNNLSLTAGGSSGGEGSIVKQRGSMIGIGSDIAGSIRIPALCNGVYGLKPTFGRLPISNQMIGGREDFISIKPNIGPIANSLDDIELLMKAVIDSRPWDRYYDCSYIPWRKYESSDKPLRIGLIISDPTFPVYSTIKRCLTEAGEKLSASGHHIVNIAKHPSYEQAWKLCLENYMVDPQGAEAFKLLKASGQPAIKSMSQQGLEYFKPDPPKDINSLIQLKTKMNNISKEWFAIFADNDLDALLCPGNCSTAPPHDTYGIPPYTAMWNLVDYPACVIPYGSVDTVKDTPENLEKTYPEFINFYASFDDPEKYSGGIGHLQLVSKPFMEEKLIAVGKVINNILKQ